MKFFNDKNKQLTKWNRNYFYLGTILVILVCVIIALQLGFSWHFKMFDETAKYSSQISFVNFFSPMFSALDHSSWRHLVGNIIGFSIMGIYLERKIGTIKFINLCIIFMFFSTSLSTHMKGDILHLGLSGVNFSLYSFVMIDFGFSLKKDRRNLINILLGVVAIVYAYVFSMSHGGNGFTDITYYPKNLIEHSGHFAGFFVGILIGLFYQMVVYKPKNRE